MQLNREQLIKKLRGHIASNYKNQSGFAREIGVSRSMVSAVVNGDKEPTKAMLDSLKLKKKIVFVEA